MKKSTKTVAERRLIILKDALKQLIQKKFIANVGDVLEVDYGYGLFPNVYSDDENKQVQPILKKLLKENKTFKCKVCARGALLLSTIHKENSFTKGELQCVSGGSFSEDSVEDKRLLKLFSEQQIMLMENAFERGINKHLLDSELANKSENFGRKYDKDEDRLIAILKNSIKNNGRFRP